MDDRALTEELARAAGVSVNAGELDGLFGFKPELTEWSLNAAADRRGALRTSVWTRDRGTAAAVVESFVPRFGAMREALVSDDFEGVGLALRGGPSSFRWWTLAGDGELLAEKARRTWWELAAVIDEVLTAAGGPHTCAALGVEIAARPPTLPTGLPRGPSFGPPGAPSFAPGGVPGAPVSGPPGAASFSAPGEMPGAALPGPPGAPSFAPRGGMAGAAIAGPPGAPPFAPGAHGGVTLAPSDPAPWPERRTIYAELRTPAAALRVLELARVVVSQPANLFWKGIVGLEPDGRPWPRVWVGRSVGPGGGWKFYYFARGDELRRTDAVLLDAVSASPETRAVWTRLCAATSKPCVQLIGLTFPEAGAPSFTTYLART